MLTLIIYTLLKKIYDEDYHRKLLKNGMRAIFPFLYLINQL